MDIRATNRTAICDNEETGDCKDCGYAHAIYDREYEIVCSEGENPSITMFSESQRSCLMCYIKTMTKQYVSTYRVYVHVSSDANSG